MKTTTTKKISEIPDTGSQEIKSYIQIKSCDKSGECNKKIGILSSLPTLDLHYNSNHTYPHPLQNMNIFF